MARPQLENGHTRIANEILEHLIKIHLSPNQWQVLLCIIRKTYGFNKKVDYIANFQIVEATGLGKEVVSRCLKCLTEMNLLTRNKKIVGFQKDWDLWKLAVSSTLGTKLAEQSTNEKLAVSSTELAVSSTELAVSSTKVSSPHVAQKTKDTYQKTLIKRQYGEFNNVLLTDEEYTKLVNKFGEDKTKELLETLSSGIKSKGYKYLDHYATILNWERRDRKQNNLKDGQNATYKRNSTKLPDRNSYTKPPPNPKIDRLVAEARAAREKSGSDQPG